MIIEYSPSSRAACRGPRPCQGTKIGKGELRLGEPTENMFSDGGVSYKYRHWGCVTPYLLRNIRVSGGARGLEGFTRLKIEDQHKVTDAVANGKIDPADIPPSAQSIDLTSLDIPQPSVAESSSQTTSQVTLGGKKRKRDEFSQATSTQASILSQTQDIVELSDTSEDGSISGPTAKKRKALDSAPAGLASAAVVARGIIPTENQEVVDLGDSDNDSDAGDEEVYVELDTAVVGIKYYTGLVGVGEQVDLVRQPSNQYDRNAICVENISGHQVGHLPANVVAKLSPLIDRGLISVEGTMTSGNLHSSSAWKLSMSVAIIGPSDPLRRKALEPMLIWATPRQAGFDPLRTGVAGTSSSKKGQSSRVSKNNPAESVKAAQLRGIVENMTKLDDGNRRETMLNTLCCDDVLDLEVYSSSPSRASGALKVDLLKHQKQALLWCINTENPKLPTKPSDKPVQFWQFNTNGNKRYYYNIATKTPQEGVPKLGRGGIIGDDMGLGKTLTMLSLIFATREEKCANGYCNATLIVAPLSVLSNWSSQIEDHFTKSAGLKAYVYYGDARNVKASFLMQQDVVITTYQSVTADLPSSKKIVDPDGRETIQVSKTKSGLFAVNWKRVVLDEGHTIRNHKTKMAMSCYALNAERRWIVSGTPIINNPADLGSLLRFLRICNPLDNPEYFKRLISRPLAKRDPGAAELLKALMSSICIRRTKDMQDKDGKALVPLPPVTFHVVPIQLDEETREFYEAVEEEARGLVQEFVGRGGIRSEMPTGVNVLSMLTRLRQIALDRSLVPSTYLDELRALAVVQQQNAAPGHHPSVAISPEQRRRLQDILEQAIKDSEECPICFDTMNDPRVTVCAHKFCLLCITEEDESGDEDESSDSSEPDDSGNEQPSAKVAQLIELLRLQPSDSKSLVFSQFTSFLDIIGTHLHKAGISFVRFDGSMTAKKRQAVLERFSEPLAPSLDQSLQNGDDEETEPDFDDDRYEEYMEKKKRREKKGKGKAAAAAAAAVQRFLDRGTAPNPVVMLISLKSGALGLNCTVANNVFLMDPFWHDAIESQAIDRVNRLGQKKDVFVYQMVAENTIEAKVLAIQERKKELVKQAFSGNKTKQSQREKKEARLHELVELFSKK
ncbi:hypothetical protein FRC18_007854 [Serendipita sp. 400]|nr:hypothetical protein FRC18_007854 [Serendipita sp. 400]